MNTPNYNNFKQNHQADFVSRYNDFIERCAKDYKAHPVTLLGAILGTTTGKLWPLIGSDNLIELLEANITLIKEEQE
jgi:hypothetical protein